MRLRINKSLSEGELVKACKRLDKGAQEQLFSKYAPVMLGICRRYTGNIHDAEDVMIGGFMKVFDKIDQYQGAGSFEGWIKRIMINDSLGFLRKNKSMYLEVDIEKANERPDLNKLDAALDTEDLLSIISELPPGYRLIFNLYAIEGYSHKEIGVKLGITESTSKSQLSRARVILKKKLLDAEKMLEGKITSHEDK